MWYGVDVSNDHVYSLVLPQNGLKGVIPSHIVNLTGLQMLHLNGNDIFDVDLEHISKMESLIHMRFLGNELIGTDDNWPNCLPEVWSRIDFDHIAFHVPSCIDTTSAKTDREVLIALYEANDGDNWTNHDAWLTEAPLDEWYGIDIDNNRRVQSILLDNNKLRGVLPIKSVNYRK